MTCRTVVVSALVSGKSSRGIGVNVDGGQYSSGRVKNSGPFQCSDDDAMVVGRSPRDAGSAGFSCVRT